MRAFSSRLQQSVTSIKQSLAAALAPAPDPRQAIPEAQQRSLLDGLEEERADTTASRAMLESHAQRLNALLPAIAAQIDRSQALGDAGLLGDTGHLYATAQGTIAALRAEADRLAQRDQRLALIGDYLAASVLTAEASRLVGVPQPLPAAPDESPDSRAVPSITPDMDMSPANEATMEIDDAGGPPRVTVVGGFNVDLVVSAPRQPLPGETLVGTAFGTFIGGKGANQAVAAARAGARVEMVGRLGRDQFGDDVATALGQEGISLRYAVRDPLEGTGIAQILVEPDGTNSIVVVPRANARLAVSDLTRARPALRGASVLLLQLEVGLDVSERAARVARDTGAMVLLNPAPARPVPDSLLRLVDVLIPNETETAELTGINPATDADAEQAARALLARGVKAVILTLGARGVLVVDATGSTTVPAFVVEVVDTTAAGDAFCGALAVALAEGRPLREAARFACASGALAVTVMGAGPSLPGRAAIERLLHTATG